MSIQDPIADMLTRIRNGQSVSKKSVSMPHSKLKLAIAKVLEDEGYITGISEEQCEDGHRQLTISLKYYEGKPVISNLEKVSKPSLRIYKPSSEVPRVENGLGIAIISTSKGVMAGYQARKLGLGGEVLCFVS